jgi:hypothetical protein
MVIRCIAVVLGLLPAHEQFLKRLVPELKVAGLKYSRSQAFKRHPLGMSVHPKGQLSC